MLSAPASARLESHLRRLLRSCPLDEWEAGKVVGDLGEDAVADMRLEKDRLSLILSLPFALSHVATALEARLRATLQPHLEGRTIALVLTSNKVVAAKDTARAAPPRQHGMAGVKIVLGVASGKGGVGKSTLAVNLAIALAQMQRACDADEREEKKDKNTKSKTRPKDTKLKTRPKTRPWRIGLLDADLYGPSLVPMLALDQPPRRNEEGLLIPEQRFGIQTLSMGSMIDAKQALVWRGPLIARALKQMLEGSAWGELDLLLLDMPPGTGDLPLSLAQSAHLDAALLVATPQRVALYDVQKSIALFVKLRVGIVGLVENMSTFRCPQCGHESPVFGQEGAARMASEHNIPLLGRLPLSQALQESADKAIPFMLLPQDRAKHRAPKKDTKGDRKSSSVLQEAQSLQAEEIRATIRSIACSIAESVAKMITERSVNQPFAEQP